MKTLLLRLFFGALFLTVCSQVYSQWTLTNGPYGGRTQAIVTLGSSIFAGDDGGGVFVSSDNGTTWTAANNGLTNLRVISLVVNGNDLLAGTNDGMFRSSDSGASWSEVGNFNIVSSIINDGGTLYAASGGWIYTSTDGGTNWSFISDVNTAISLAISGSNIVAVGYGIYVTPKSGGSGILVLSDNGNNTAVISAGGIVYAGSGGMLVRSTDDGMTWTTIHDFQIQISTILILDNSIYVGTNGAGLQVSSDGGTTWNSSSSGMTNSGVRTLALFNSKMFAGTFAGVFVSQDYGASWSPSSVGMNVCNISCLGLLDNKLAVGIDGPTVISPDNGATFISSQTSPWYPQAIFQVNSTWLISGGAALMRSSDHGASWQGSNPATGFVSFALFDNALFAARPGYGVYRSTDEGATWSAASLANLYATTLVANGNNLFAGTEGNGVFRSSDSGATWAPANSGLPDLRVNTLATNGDQIFVGTYGAGVFMSDNAGASWKQVNAGLSAPYVYSLVTVGGKIFAGTSSGVYSSETTNIAWSLSGLSSVVIGHLLVNEGKIFAGTRSGLYTQSLPKVDQTITFNSLTPVSYGSAAVDLTATASSSLPVSYASSNPNVAVINNNKVTVVGAGTSVITASQIGNANYNPAVDAVQTLTVTKADQTITFKSLPLTTDKVTSLSLVDYASSNSGLTLSFESSNTSVATVSGNTITILNAGTTTITAKQSGNQNYNAASDVSQTLTIKKAQTIIFNSIPSMAVTDAAFDLGNYASVNSSLQLTYTSSNASVATVSGGTVTILGVGTTTITAQQAGDATYAPAQPVQQVLAVFSKVIGLSSSSVTHDTLSFGTVTIGLSKTLKFSILNSGTASLAVSSIQFPTGFVGDLQNGTIPAGGKLDVNVTFSPVEAAAFAGTITITSDATSGKNKLVVSGKGEKITAVETSDASFSVFPNPGEGIYTIAGIDEQLSKRDVQVVDCTGRSQHDFNLTSIGQAGYQLDIRAQSSGLYLILVRGRLAIRIIKN